MKQFLISVIAALYASAVFSAGVLVESRASMDPPQRIVLAWTADTNGSVVVTSQVVRGEMNRVVLYDGTTASTGATYAVTLTDALGVDTLAGQGSAIATNAVTQILPGAFSVVATGVTNLESIVVNDRLIFTTSGVGSNRQGNVVIYLK